MKKVPLFTWLPGYRSAWIGRDLLAGVAIWAVVTPLAMACAALVGVAPIVGLYTVPLAALAYAIFGGSRLFVIGPDTAVAVLAGGVIATVAVGSTENVALAIYLALIAGAIYLLFSILRMGWIADLIPEPVLKGFIEGIVWLTILKQLADFVGLEKEGSSSAFYSLIYDFAKRIPDAHLMTTIIGVVSIAVLVLFKRFLPKIPGSVAVLIGSISVVSLAGLGDSGVPVIGEIAGGLPDLSGLADVEFEQIIALVPGALAIVVLGFTKSLAVLRLAAEQSKDQIEPNRELRAIGASNIGAGIGGGYALAGSLTATTVGLGAGTKSQFASLFAGLLCVLTIAFLLPLLAFLPLSSLSAIIVVALVGLSDPGYFRRLWSMRRDEFAIAMAAFVGVLVFGVMPGVLIGVVLALIKLAHAIHSPTTAVVGRTPSGAFVDLDEHDDAKEIPGMLIWRQYGPIVFLNARVLSNELRRVVQGRDRTDVVVFDATTASGIDTSAAEALLAARDDLRADGIDMWVVNPRQKGWTLVAAMLEKDKAAPPRNFESLSAAAAEFESMKPQERP